jgi:LmbE family N-acetylglucosaminyl deacetylase
LHPDHHAGGRLLIDALVAARDPHYFPGAGAPHRPEHLLLFEAQVVDHVERVTDAEAQAKIDALLAHRSQWLSTMGIAAGTADAEAQHAQFAGGLREQIRVSGGEPFKRIDEL